MKKMDNWKGTKGEWKIESDNNWECLVYTEDENHSFEIHNNDIEGFDEMWANAKLIAAAPELLEALQNIYDAQFNPNKTLANLNSEIAESIKAINKAL